MNCFRIVSLNYWKQRKNIQTTRSKSCELLSNCIFELLKTAMHDWGRELCRLWIAFELYLWIIENSYLSSSSRSGTLWIAFELYLWIIENSEEYYKLSNPSVVNCFRIVSLNYWKQLLELTHFLPWCCELLSNCIFELLKTAADAKLKMDDQLWIAFELYLWIIENSNYFQYLRTSPVVNCFRIVSLNYWKQRTVKTIILLKRCELLSNCIFELLKTARSLFFLLYAMLWIAFELYLWIIENSFHVY